MGLGYDLTLNHPDLTPLYIKALDSGVYAEKSGDSFALDTANGSIDTLRYWEYNASMYLADKTKYISIEDTTSIRDKLKTNLADKTKAGHRLCALYISDTTTNLLQYPIYEWYLNISNTERLIITCTGANTFSVSYVATMGAVVVYNLSAVGVNLTVGWHVFQVHHSYNGVNRQAGVYIDGQQVIAMTNASSATDIDIAGAAKFSVCRNINPDPASTGAMYFDLFLIRQGLPFCLTWTDQPTDPAWQGAGYLNRPYQGGYIVPKDLGPAIPIRPSCFPENTVPQGIPCSVVARDVVYTVGIGNYKTYKLLNYASWANNPDFPVIASQSFLNLKKDSFFGSVKESAQSAVAGTVEAGSYLASISFFNSKTGEETELSPFVGNGFNGNTNDAAVVLTGLLRYNITVYKREQTVFYDKIKFWKKNTANGKIYYCGMGRADGTSTTVISSNWISATIEDNTVLTQCQEFTQFLVPDLYCVDKLGLPKPSAPTFNSSVAGAGFTNGNYEFRMFNIDPRTGTRSGLSNPFKYNLAVAATTIILNQTTVNRLNDWYAVGMAARFIGGGEQNYTTYLDSASTNVNQLNPPSNATYTLLSIYQSGIISDLTLDLPASCDYIEYHDDRLFYACFSDAKHKIQWSQVDELELVSDNDYLLIGDASDPITGLKSIGGVLVVTTLKTFGIVTGSGGVYNYQRLSSEYGCVSNRTIQLIKGNLYFCSSNGPCIYTGSDFKFIGEPIESVFKTMNPRMRPLMTSTVDSQNNLYLVGVCTVNTQTSADSLDTISYRYNNNKIYAYNYEESSLSNNEYIWTELSIPNSDMTSVLLQDKEETFAVVNLIPNSGSNPITSPGNSGLQFNNQASYKDYGNYSTNNISWQITFDPLYAKFGRNNQWVEVNFFPITDQLLASNTYTCGYEVKGVSYTSNLVATSDVEILQKKMSLRGRFAAATISGSTVEQFILAGYTMKMQEVGYR